MSFSTFSQTTNFKLIRKARNWLIHDFFGIVKEMRLSYLPPLMIFFAAGISSFTVIVETFFVKNNLNLDASFIATLAFWAGLPWTLKMPLGHLVDLFWSKKSWFVYIGAILMAISLLIMVGLTGYPEEIKKFLTLEKWYVLSAIIAPIGFVMQNVVADAMTVEAVPQFNPDGEKIPSKELHEMHTTMQTLGRIAVVGGGAIVAGAGGWLATAVSYKVMYEVSLIIPFISISGIILNNWILKKRKDQLHAYGLSEKEINKVVEHQPKKIKINWPLLWGSIFLVALSIGLILSSFSYKAEAVFILSLGIMIFLIAELIKDNHSAKRQEIIAIAIIVFIYRATPTFGAGASWWQIDALHFNEAFFGTLRQTSAILAIVGMLALRHWIARHSIAYLIIFLSIFSSFLLLPFIGMFYGLHFWTLNHFGFGAKTIALIDTAADSPLDQVSMIPMLAWIAKEAPIHQKATYFAVFTAFANLALSASSLATVYVNKIFTVNRGDYSQLGWLMIAVMLISLIIPILTVMLLTPKLKTRQPS